MPGDAKGAAQDERRPCFFAKPQAILFDLDDTVFDFTACSQQALRRACQAQGIPFDGTLYLNHLFPVNDAQKTVDYYEIILPIS